MPETSAQWVRLLERDLKEVSDERQKYVDDMSMINRIYRTVPSSKAWEEFFSVGQVPDIVAFTGRLSMLDVTPGYSTRIEASQYGGYVESERTLIDDEQYGKLRDLAAGLVDSASRVREDNAARPIANATSVAFDFISNQEEGVALASNSHLTKVPGVSTANGYDNLGSSALNPVSTAATRILMKGFRSPIGRRWNGSRRFGLLVPYSLEFRAQEIVQTQKGVSDASGFSAEHRKNVQEGIYEVIVWDRLEDTSSTAWGMVDLEMMKRNMIYISRVNAETEREVDFMTKAVRQSVYDRHAFGFIDWRHYYHHAA